MKKINDYNNVKVLRMFERPEITFLGVLKINETSNILFKKKNFKQELKNLILTTKIKEKQKDYEVNYKIIKKLNVGDLLIYDDDNGYIVANKKLTTVDDYKQEIELLKGL